MNDERAKDRASGAGGSQFFARIGKGLVWFSSMAASLGRAVDEWCAEYGPLLEAMPAAIREVIRADTESLHTHGWYIDEGMPLAVIREVAEAFSTSAEQGNQLAIEFMRTRVDDIENKLRKMWSRRDSVLSQAFDAHRAGAYAVSIPVFLAQAEGLAVEFFEPDPPDRVTLYGTSREKFAASAKQLLEKHREQLLDDLIAEYRELGLDEPTLDHGERMPYAVDIGDFLLALLDSLVRATPLNANSSERGKAPKLKHALNRNLVLHGVDLDYGNEANSLRAISHLSYIDFVIESFQDEEPRTRS